MEKTCGNCFALMKDKGKPYYCDGHDFDYHEENDVACADWSYGEQEDEHDEHGET